MKAITVWQPWAGALAAGIKENETRSWATKYRGPLAIHSAMKAIQHTWSDLYMNDEAREVICRRLDLPEIIDGPATFPMGYILATGELVDCIRITPEYVATLSPDELTLGDYTPGRYAWKLANVKRLPEPIPAKGRQGLWNWEALLLRHKGRDSWDRPVYEDETGKLWKDVEPGINCGPKLCSALYNAFDGEPDTPMEYMKKYEGVPVVFLPERDTWTW